MFVIFGATGDLMRRKLLPALYQLAESKLLPPHCRILGVARDQVLTDAEFRKWGQAALAEAEYNAAEDVVNWCNRNLYYQPAGATTLTVYQALGERIAALEAENGLPGNRVLYLALPPGAFPGTIEALGLAGLNHRPGWTRLVIEKPFGRDLATAQELNALVHQNFDEAQVYRIDHYLGKETVRVGQYAAGAANGTSLPGYLQESGVAADSQVETFIAMRLAIENWRWQGVPFYLRTGKRLARRVTQIVIEFRSPPVALFRSMNGCSPCTNVLTITLQPDEGFELSFEVKTPGEQFNLQTERMKFVYPSAFGALSAGYDTLLLDVIEGDQTLFVHAEETEASWRLYTPLLSERPPVRSYPAGSWGPQAALDLIETANDSWITR